MCRLLGIVANQPVDLVFSLRRFQGLAKKNPDGWGIGWWEQGEPKCEKEPRSAEESECYTAVSGEATSQIFICHVRRATQGKRKPENTHPFIYENRWMFAHNGTVCWEKLLERLDGRYRNAIRGDTDSEVYFLWILQNIEAAACPEEGIARALHEVRRWDHTSLNFLLSDGRYLYAYREASKDLGYYSLYWLERDPQSPHDSYTSKETRALIELKRQRGERAVLVCSERLTDESWQAIPNRHLLRIGLDLRVDPVPLE